MIYNIVSSKGVRQMDKETLQVLWNSMKQQLNEMQRRQYAATLAKAYGYGGATVVREATGVSLNTITVGKKELEQKSNLHTKRVRKEGAGRKYTEEKHPDVYEKIQRLIDGSTYGNPERVLPYTTESLRKIESELKSQGVNASHVTVGEILDSMGYSKQANQKMLQAGEPRPDRNAQFEHINKVASEYIDKGIPVISADTKKRENIGNFKNNGRECRLNKDPRKV